MCFNEIHVEFDAEGNAYLGEEAEDPSYPGDDPGNECPDHDDCWCAHDADIPVETEPEEAYDAILSDVSENARELLDDTPADSGRDGHRSRDSARGD